MHPLDLTILAAYLVVIFGIALILRARSARDIDHYFLGNRRMGWWLLGASGMASNVDLAGTMVIASLLYIYGPKGFFIELRGGIVLIMAFFLAYMGKWTRRSGRMTIAEWMSFRFGTGIAGNLPRVMAALGQIVFFIWALAYFLTATVKFFEVFLPDWNALGCSAGLIVVVMIYTTLAGLSGVVWTDFVQGVLILFAAGYFSYRALVAVDAATLADLTGAGWTSLWPGWHEESPPGYEQFNFFGLGVVFYLLKTTVDGMSGAGGYMTQRYFAARDARECGLLSLLWISLMTFRWPLMMAIAVLAYTLPERVEDPELVLPVVVQTLVPVGIRGLVLAALMAAVMSTYSSVINAGASYFVKDIYQAFMRPAAGARELVTVSYTSTILLVLAGLGLAYGMKSINDVWGWLTMSLGAGLLVPNFLRWYWWRLNGFGYAAGTFVGMVVAIGQAWWFGDWPEYQSFACVAMTSVLAMVVVSLLTRPTDRRVLIEFYRTTRPFGSWRPMREQLGDVEQRSILKENRQEILTSILAVAWQLLLFATPMMVIVREWRTAAWLFAALLLVSLGLYLTWFRHLDTGDAQNQG